MIEGGPNLLHYDCLTKGAYCTEFRQQSKWIVLPTPLPYDRHVVVTIKMKLCSKFEPLKRPMDQHDNEKRHRTHYSVIANEGKGNSHCL